MFPLPHLRSGFRRRGPSNPTSPIPDQHQQTYWDSSTLQDYPHAAQDASPRPDSRPDSSNSFYMPPTLPPITRVTSAEEQLHFDQGADEAAPQEQHYVPARNTQRRDDDVGFMGGVALANHRRNMEEGQRRENMVAATATSREPQQPRSRVPPPPINTGIPYQRPAPLPNVQTRGGSFVTPTDLQQLSAEPEGKRPSGTRLATEPVVLTHQVLTHQLQALEISSRGKRTGLSSLKDRFLMKRKAGPVTPEIGPVSPRSPNKPEFPDPRILGRRFHDFDNPQRRKPVPQHQSIPDQAAPLTQHDLDLQTSQGVPAARDESTLQHERHGSGNNSPEQRRHDAAIASNGVNQRNRRQLSLDKALPKEPHQLRTDLEHGSSGQTDVFSQQGASGVPRSNPSSRTVRSRVSVSDPTRRDSTMSAIPKHMKSTSSRFSFDMVGDAQEEKLLEEKHRQRQMQKTADDSGFAARDSRFDDFDNEDYDYDAMMEDDGIEEPIPGVNADAEDDDYPEEEIPGMNEEIAEDEYLQQEELREEMDPDNDQENFSGFVFQRSNPASAVTSPLPSDMLPTPRDPTGKVIGFAVTKDMTPELAPGPSPLYQNTFAAGDTIGATSEGLGIQGLDVQTLQDAFNGTQYGNGHALQPESLDVNLSVASTNDDLYYEDGYIDDGLRDELDFEAEGPPFDEALFDLNDTDQYGRPIPGAFAQAAAKSMMTAQQQVAERQSNDTSMASWQSPVPASTAHTSLEVGLQPVLPISDTKGHMLDLGQPSERRSSVAVPAPSSELAYQAALAEAAHKAAASGKFRRGSSPPPPDPNFLITSPTDSTESLSKSHPDNGLDLEDDCAPRGLDDDYELDDDDVIAEANAEALANDADGWYGREFGFYSAPLPAPSHGRGHKGKNPASNALSSPKPLSEQNLFQYANGGYFGPEGALIRSASGRVVSREPNLTPITEMSEYSNRNSVMSFPGISAGGQQPQQQIQSPGLAELAQMSLSDDIGSLSMSSLMRLRSKTFGSNSRVSLPSSPEGSPRSEFSPLRDGSTSPWGAPSNFNPGYSGSNTHMRKNSAFSMQSTVSDGGTSGAGSPTLTMTVPPVPSSGGLAPSPFPQNQGVYPATSPSLPNLKFPPVMEEDFIPIPTTQHPPAQQSHPDAPLGLLPGEMVHASPTAVNLDESGRPLSSPTSPRNSGGYQQGQQGQQQRRPGGMGHRHKGSADSISYVKEEQSGAWVMERIRTSVETGEVEVLEREVVRGGI